MTNEKGPSELHAEIISFTEPDENGRLCLPAENAKRLHVRLFALLTSSKMPATVDAFVRAVAAFQASGRSETAQRLISVGEAVVSELRRQNRPEADKVRAAVTGADNLSKMRPVGGGPAPDGAVKGAALIRPLPRPRR